MSMFERLYIKAKASDFIRICALLYSHITMEISIEMDARTYTYTDDYMIMSKIVQSMAPIVCAVKRSTLLCSKLFKAPVFDYDVGNISHLVHELARINEEYIFKCYELISMYEVNTTGYVRRYIKMNTSRKLHMAYDMARKVSGDMYTTIATTLVDAVGYGNGIDIQSMTTLVNDIIKPIVVGLVDDLVNTDIKNIGDIRKLGYHTCVVDGERKLVLRDSDKLFMDACYNEYKAKYLTVLSIIMDRVNGSAERLNYIKLYTSKMIVVLSGEGFDLSTTVTSKIDNPLKQGHDMIEYEFTKIFMEMRNDDGFYDVINDMIVTGDPDS